ncbi:hypothetical protein B0H66DRAFT_40547 [Apodospora peruviana]|uniref:Uncharacterized protein n=1 Tax=Apodospora peruviana TaxID=516989 RepID=A0AAE0IRD1_9PEZI|nr:hypothetical protein B0H66DRAFT_40547 [Apodospora peruviana]
MIMPSSYTIRYPHPVNKITWYTVEQDIRITILSTAIIDGMSPPGSPAASSISSGGSEELNETAVAERSSAIFSTATSQSTSLEVAGDMVVERLSRQTNATSSTASVTVLTPSHTTAASEAAAAARRRIEQGCVHGSEAECECLRIDRLETLQEVLTEKERHRKLTFEEMRRTPVVPPRQSVVANKAISNFSLAFPGFDGRRIDVPVQHQLIEVAWDELDTEA